MNAHVFIPIRAAALALIFCSGAHAQMYKWVAEDGSVTYSNQPPPERAEVRELKKIEDINTVPLDKPKAAVAPRAKPETPPAAASQWLPPTAGDPLFDNPALPPKPQIAITPSESPPSSAEAPRRMVTRGIQTEAVQDPCLTSPDPRCHEHHKDSYDPFLGYAPGALHAGNAAPVGATSAASGGGAIGAAVKR